MTRLAKNEMSEGAEKGACSHRKPRDGAFLTSVRTFSQKQSGNSGMAGMGGRRDDSAWRYSTFVGGHMATRLFCEAAPHQAATRSYADALPCWQ